MIRAFLELRHWLLKIGIRDLTGIRVTVEFEHRRDAERAAYALRDDARGKEGEIALRHPGFMVRKIAGIDVKIVSPVD